jgi:hypothetical protein
LFSLSSSQTSDTSVWGGTLVNYAGTWEFYYEDHDATTGATTMRRATGATIAALTPDGTYAFAPDSDTSADQALTANLTTAPGRTVTVGDASNFVQDGPVILSQSTTNDDWSYSKVRKVTSSTQLELYHGITGFTTTKPARIKQINTSPNWTPRALVLIGSEWWLFHNEWEPWLNGANSASYSSLQEENHLFIHSNASPSGGTFALQYQPSPSPLRGQFANQRSFENMTLVTDPYGAVGGAGNVPTYPGADGCGVFYRSESGLLLPDRTQDAFAHLRAA